MLSVTAALFALIGIALAALGGWLAVLGGSPAYLVLAIAILIVAVLLFRRNGAAIGLFALTVILWPSGRCGRSASTGGNWRHAAGWSC